jgi:uncharacterized protein YgiM (DUF1202 family)
MRLRSFWTVAAFVFVAATSRAHAQPAITWDPAHSGNYRVESGRTIDMIVIHKAEGSLSSAVSWFQNSAAKVSAHYVVNANEVVQTVQDKNEAWHAGNHAYNMRSIGIENEGYSARNDITDAHYRRLAQLVAYLCNKYSISIDRQHIIGHYQVPDPNHPGEFGGADHHIHCPGPNFDWTLFMSYVNQYAGSSTPPPAPAPRPAPRPAPQPQPAPPASGSNQAVTVTASTLNVRDAAYGNILGVVPNGSGWVLTGNSNQGYSEIYYAGGTAWIYSAYTTGYSGTGAEITASSVNVRAGASTGSSIVGSAYQGQVYVESGKSGSWTQIRYDANRRWVYSSYTTDVAVSP